MKIAIMQPYFFPYLGQFQLINLAERFILMDDVQYIRHGWINRNRILGAQSGFQYMTAPVRKQSLGTKIRMIRVVEGNDWKKAIFNQLNLYRRAPFYLQVKELMSTALAPDETNITVLNGNCFQSVCNYIGIPLKIEIASMLNLDYSEIRETQDWAIEMCRQLNATEYYNPPGGVNLYDRKKFAENGIALRFVAPHLEEYCQGRPEFAPGLSIVDVMMFNSPEKIRTMLNNYTIL